VYLRLLSFTSTLHLPQLPPHDTNECACNSAIHQVSPSMMAAHVTISGVDADGQDKCCNVGHEDKFEARSFYQFTEDHSFGSTFPSFP
jgi:hypothetical protein